MIPSASLASLKGFRHSDQRTARGQWGGDPALRKRRWMTNEPESSSIGSPHTPFMTAKETRIHSRWHKLAARESLQYQSVPHPLIKIAYFELSTVVSFAARSNLIHDRQPGIQRPMSQVTTLIIKATVIITQILEPALRHECQTECPFKAAVPYSHKVSSAKTTARIKRSQGNIILPE
jgi:hypothetical protein